MRKIALLLSPGVSTHYMSGRTSCRDQVVRIALANRERCVAPQSKEGAEMATP
jgi:hypothetical protein